MNVIILPCSPLSRKTVVSYTLFHLLSHFGMGEIRPQFVQVEEYDFPHIRLRSHEKLARLPVRLIILDKILVTPVAERYSCPNTFAKEESFRNEAERGRRRRRVCSAGIR